MFFWIGVVFVLLVVFVDLHFRRVQNRFVRVKNTSRNDDSPDRLPVENADPLFGMLKFIYNVVIMKTSQATMSTTKLSRQPKLKTEVGVIFGMPFVSTWNSTFLKQILIQDRHLFVKGLPIKSFIPIMGSSVALISGEEEWKHQREILNPSFQLDFIKSLCPNFVEIGDRLCNQLEIEAKKSGSFSPFLWMNKFTLDSFGKAGFGFEFRTLDSENTSDIYFAYSVLADEISNPLRLIPWYGKLPIEHNKKFLECKRLFFDWAQQMVDKKRECLSQNHDSDYIPDLLDLLVTARDKDGLSDNELLQNIFIFFLAGHETSSGVLTTVLHFFGKYPDIQEKCRLEVESVIGNGDIDAKLLKKLEFMGKVINESLRLLGPVRSLIRETIEDCTLGDYFIPKGTYVSLQLRNMQTDPEIWGSDVNEFNVDRWNSNRQRHEDLLFMPFGYGPRICIGKNFAMLEIQTLLVQLLRKFEFYKISEWQSSRSMTERPQAGYLLGIKIRE